MRSISEWDKIEKQCASPNLAEVVFIAAFGAFALVVLVGMLAIRFL